MWTRKPYRRAIASAVVAFAVGVIVMQCGTNAGTVNAPEALQTVSSYKPVMPVAVGQTWTHQHIPDVYLDLTAQTGTGFLTTIRVNGNQLVIEIPTGKLDGFLANPAGTWQQSITAATESE